MNRREILKGLRFAPLFGVPSFLSEEEIPQEIEELIYKEFKLVWSGYNRNPDAEKLTGFWIATNIKDEEIAFSSCTGGFSNEYKVGYIINTCVLADHTFLTFNSSEEDKKEEKQRALNKLKEDIDNYYKPKNIEEPEYVFGFTGFKS